MATFSKSQIPDIVLAKWRNHDASTDTHYWARGYRFVGHMVECLLMTQFLFDGVPFGERLHKIMALPVPLAEFRRLCLLSVMLHDLGKAGGEFQKMLWNLEYWHQDGMPGGINNKPRYKQAYRHELLSLVLAHTVPEIRAWVRSQVGSDEAYAMVLAGAFGHHRKTENEIKVHPVDGIQTSRVSLSQICSDLNKLVARFGFSPFPQVPDIMLSTQEVKDRFDSIQDDDLFLDSRENPTSAAIKWVTILGDSLGSSGPPTKDGMGTYRLNLQEALKDSYAPLNIDYFSRIKGWEAIQNTLHAFQTECRATVGDAFLTASCGSGKTAAAYLWASNRPDLRMIYTTPTTGTATQIHEEYKTSAPDGVRHSRSSVDREIQHRLVPTPDVDTENEDRADAISLLQDWDHLGKEVTHATVDQLLGLLAFGHKSIMWLIYLTQSQIVLDEFHAFDPLLSGWHHKFLEWFPGLRTMHLSATVTKQQEDRLKVHRPHLTVVRDPNTGSDPASLPRYRIHVLTDYNQAKAHFGGGALWVVNTVRRAQNVGQMFPDATVFHSRFRYCDRRKIQKDLVEGFDPKAGSSLRAVATQVAEISLDISAKVLISEICRPANMIQRLGRLNRVAVPTEVRDAYFYMPEDGFPYDPRGKLDPFKGWLAWLKGLEGRDLSQRDLDTAFLSLPDHKKPVSVVSDYMVRTQKRPLREGLSSDVCLLKQDLVSDPDLYKKGKGRKMVEIPVFLSTSEKASLEVVGYHYVASYHYDPRLGLLKP